MTNARLTKTKTDGAILFLLLSLSRISLNWPLNAQQHEKTFFQRAAFHQALLDKKPHIINDDVWTFNSQVSTQWDGLRHFGYQEAGLFYGGRCQHDIHGVDEGTGERSTVLGIQGKPLSLSLYFCLFGLFPYKKVATFVLPLSRFVLLVRSNSGMG